MINLENILFYPDAHWKHSRTRSSLNFEETSKVTLIRKLRNFPTFLNFLIIFQKLEKIISIQRIKTS